MAYLYLDIPRADILRMVPPLEAGKGRMASIGCGYAASEAVLAEKGWEIHGADIAPEAIAVARTRLASATLLQPGQALPWEEASFDGLLLADVIEHLADARESLAAFARLVKPGGWIVISVPNMRQINIVWEFLIKGDWPELDSGIFDRTHLQVMSRKRLIRWCDDAGIRIEKWFDVYSPFGPRRYRFFRACDWLTLRMLHSWWIYQLQVRCRRD